MLCFTVFAAGFGKVPCDPTFSIWDNSYHGPTIRLKRTNSLASFYECGCFKLRL